MKNTDRQTREIEKMREAFAAPRPGGLRAALQPPGAENTGEAFARHGVELSDILYLRTDSLKANPNNEYPPLDADEMAELVRDIQEKGILVPLITKSDGTIVCGHNRHRAAGEAGLDRVPVQQIVSVISVELERDIMKSENDRRRGGQWSKEQKEKFIREKFGAEITLTTHGGQRGNQHVKLSQGSVNLASEIEKQSRGRITAGTAKRIVADMRKKAPKKPDSGSAGLRSTDGRMPAKARMPGAGTAKDRRRAGKLAVRLETIRGVIVVLEKKLANARTEEKDVLRELKALHLNG